LIFKQVASTMLENYCNYDTSVHTVAINDQVSLNFTNSEKSTCFVKK